MADISTTNKKARVPILGENGRISDAYIPQAVIDAEASSKTYAENAKSYSELVKKDAESAASSAASAKESADAAREGISSIDEKVTQVGQFAEAASSSATEANSYLSQVKEVSNTVSGIASSVAENAKTAETFANESKESAASALTASTSAVNAKVDAEGYRDSAKSYSDNAKADADTSKNILESVKTQKAYVDSTVQQFKADATEYDTKFSGYVSEAKESKEASAVSAASASESAENASTSATNASTSATNAKSSADAAALSATNAATSAKEAADNLSLLGASTLTHKEKDTLIHVNDAFPTKLMGIEIDGTYKQDGIATVDNPIAIQVVEHPVINVTGRNLMKVPFAYHHSTNPLVIGGLSYTRKDDTGSVLIKGKKTSDVTYFNLDFSTDAKALRGKSIFCMLDVDASIARFYCGFFLENGNFSTVIDSSIGKSVKVPENAVSFRVYINVITTEYIDVEVHPAIYVIDDEKLYYPYTSQQHEFTLPAEHPYMAKLPDGTADTIEVDAEGNVEFVARVTKNTLTSWICNDKNYFVCSISPARADNSVLCTGGIKMLGHQISGDVFVGTALSIVAYQPREGDTEDALNAKGLVFYYKLVKPKHYPLGKINLPALPESVSNVWTDAEITPMTGIEYVRDANIVVSNLEEAIASITQG